MSAITLFNAQNFTQICDELAGNDTRLNTILQRDGYPPMWTRPATFESLVWIILEQQVSLASARAAYEQLAQKLGTITPAALLSLSDDELRRCYFSRQKTGYVRGLAQALQEGRLDLPGLANMPDERVRAALTALKGIGDWTADVYLIFCLQRANIFPIGDIALVSSMRHEWQIPAASKEELQKIATTWQPWRSVAAMLLWHAYLERKRKK